MLEFINNNGVLFSGIFSIIVALISISVYVIKDNQSIKKETIKSLKKELAEKTAELDKIKAELANIISIETLEKNIDKSHGSIYKENLSNEKQRDICGYCWEKEHIKIPLVVNMQYDKYLQKPYYDGYCVSCKNHCMENFDSDIFDEDLPF